MIAPYFVEILSHGKEVKHRYQLDSMPIRIGRAYDNDIILDDPHIAAHHAIVEQDSEGALSIQDQGSRNGIVIGGQRQTESPIDTTTVFQLGHTHIRIRSIDCAVDEEVPVSSFHKWDGWPPAITGIAMMMLTTGISIWIDDTDKFEVSNYLSGIAVLLLISVVWSGLWSLIGRLFGGENTKFGRHIFIIGCGITSLMLFDYILAITAYSLSLEVISRYVSHIQIAFLFGIVFFHLQQIKPNNFRRFSIICIMLSLLGSSIWLLYNYTSDKMLADELNMRTRFPDSIRIAPDKPVTKLIDDAKQLKVKLDIERTSSVDEDDDDEKTSK